MADSPHIAVVVLTMFDDDESVFSAVRAGARGYLLKGADQEQILRAVYAAASGEIIFGTELAARVLAYFTAAQAVPAIFPQLTDREREVLELVAQGRSNADIAARLQLSQKTVRNHVSNILTKLQVADRAQAIVRARGPPAWATRPAPEGRKFPARPGQPTHDNGTHLPADDRHIHAGACGGDLS